jgi:hypothetical protein
MENFEEQEKMRKQKENYLQNIDELKSYLIKVKHESE